MKYFVLSLVLWFTVPAEACFDRAMKPVDAKAMLKAFGKQASFKTCTNKLKALGVDIEKSEFKQKTRPDGDTGPILRTIAIRGDMQSGQKATLVLLYDLNKKAFTCDQSITYGVSRCF